MGVFHKFFDAGANEDNPDIVRPDDWNDDHNSPAHLGIMWGEHTQSDGDVWTNQPAALTKLFGDDRSYTYADLRFATQARIVVDVHTPGASGAEVRVQYSADNGGTWAYLSADNGPSQSIAASGIFASTWKTVVPAARLEGVLLRFVGVNGNGVADPRLRSVAFFYR